MSGYGWEEHEEKYQRSLSLLCQEATNQAREVEMSKLQQLTLQAVKDSMEELINAPIYDLTEDFWIKIQEPVKAELCLVI